VVALACVLPRDYSHEPHRHRRARLTYTNSGVMSVFTPQGNWLVPPQCAVWIPCGLDHRIHARDKIHKRSIDIEPSLVTDLPRHACGVVQVSPLLRELTNAAVRMTHPYPTNRRDEKVMALLGDELCAASATSLYLPLPRDARLKRVARSLLADLASNATIDQWGNQVGASGRTLARLFVKETGLTFAAWRQHARLLAAVAQLEDGRPVASVASAMGYENASSFTSMFRRALGTTPGRYFGAEPNDAA
jgi:AraC-like DNA-binding protein